MKKILIGLNNTILDIDTIHNTGKFILNKFKQEYLNKFNNKYNTIKHFKNDEEEIFFIENQLLIVYINGYINLSGENINKFINKYNFKNETIYIFYDDVVLKAGEVILLKDNLKIKHNGVLDCIKNIDKKINYKFIRIGVNEGFKISPLREFVISKMSSELKNKLESLAISDIIMNIIT